MRNLTLDNGLRFIDEETALYSMVYRSTKGF